MKERFLLSAKAKWIGLLLFLPGLALGVANMFWEFQLKWLSFEFRKLPFVVAEKSGSLFAAKSNFTDETALTITIVGLLLITFSRLRQEDEYIGQLRLASFQWAVLVSYLLLIVVTWLVYDTFYLTALFFNILTVLVVFNIRFFWVLYRNRSKTELQ